MFLKEIDQQVLAEGDVVAEELNQKTEVLHRGLVHILRYVVLHGGGLLDKLLHITFPVLEYLHKEDQVAHGRNRHQPERVLEHLVVEAVVEELVVAGNFSDAAKFVHKLKITVDGELSFEDLEYFGVAVVELNGCLKQVERNPRLALQFGVQDDALEGLQGLLFQIVAIVGFAVVKQLHGLVLPFLLAHAALAGLDKLVLFFVDLEAVVALLAVDSAAVQV